MSYCKRSMWDASVIATLRKYTLPHTPYSTFLHPISLAWDCGSRNSREEMNQCSSIEFQNRHLSPWQREQPEEKFVSFKILTFKYQKLMILE